MSYDSFDFIRHYYWDGSRGLNIAAGHQAIDALNEPNAEELGYELTRAELHDGLDLIEKFAEDEYAVGGYCFNAGDLVIAVIDTESELGYAWSHLNDDELDPLESVATAIGLWTVPRTVRASTHAASI